MKSKRLKNLTLCILAFVMMLTLFTSASANSKKIDLNKKGSIYVSLKYEDIADVGARLTIYKVCEVKKNVFVYTDEFKNFDRTTEKLLKRGENVLRLMDYIQKNKIKGTSIYTDKNGYAEFKDLTPGMYAVRQTNDVEDFYQCSPFVASIPYQENGKYVYTRDATPKVGLDKVFEDVLGEYDFRNRDKTTTTTTAPKDNTQGSNKLIQTGHNKAIIPILAVAGGLLIVIGLIIVGKGKKKQK